MVIKDERNYLEMEKFLKIDLIFCIKGMVKSNVTVRNNIYSTMMMEIATLLIEEDRAEMGMFLLRKLPR